MGDLPHYFDIILFAMVAAFLVLRLRSVLGRRTGNERRRELLRGPAAASDKVVPLAERLPATVATLTAAAPPNTVAGGVAQITAADPGFDAPRFLDGARGAFELIVGAFAVADKPRLRSLLADEVYTPFAAAIDERVAAGETLETRIAKLDDIDITEARMEGRNARVTVKLVSEQIHVLRAHDGSIVDGDPDNLIEKTDFWTFTRAIPNRRTELVSGRHQQRLTGYPPAMRVALAVALLVVILAGLGGLIAACQRSAPPKLTLRNMAVKELAGWSDDNVAAAIPGLFEVMPGVSRARRCDAARSQGRRRRFRHGPGVARAV